MSGMENSTEILCHVCGETHDFSALGMEIDPDDPRVRAALEKTHAAMDRVWAKVEAGEPLNIKEILGLD